MPTPSTATLACTAAEYDISPPFVTVDFNGDPIEIDVVVVRRWAAGDDGEPYTAVDLSGYRRTKAGARKGSHGLLYLAAEPTGALLDTVGIDVD